jgi:hypothetical protein
MAMGVHSRFFWHVKSVSTRSADFEFFLAVSSRKTGRNCPPLLVGLFLANRAPVRAGNVGGDPGFAGRNNEYSYYHVREDYLAKQEPFLK